MKLNVLTTAAALLIGSFATSATAGTIKLTSSNPEVIEVADGSPNGQNFVHDLLGVDATHLYSGALDLIAAGPVRLTFSLVAAECGFNNRLLYNGVSIIQENVGNGSVDFATGILNSQTFSTVFNGGNLASLLSFSINGDDVAEFDSSDDEFGVFADKTKLDNLSVFFLGLDDSGANNDDNHDDIMVRVEVSAVPIPASGLLLIAGLGGMAAMRRRKKA